MSKNFISLFAFDFVNGAKTLFQAVLLLAQLGIYNLHYCGRWGEVENVHLQVHIEKVPGDLFPTEPTDEPFMARRP